MKKLITVCLVLVLMAVTTSVAYAASALPSDNFNDNSQNTSMWNLYEENSSKVWLYENNQQLEIHSAGNSGDVSANYVANGWGLSTAEDFSFRANFHASSLLGSGQYEFDAMLGLAKFGDFATMSNNNASLGAGYYSYDNGSEKQIWGDKTTDGIHVNEREITRSSDDGILYISYNTILDELYMSDTGYGTTNAFVTISGLLRGEWKADVVSPILSGDAENVVLTSGDAFLDDFVVESGTIVPEPTTICLLGLGALSLIRKKIG